MERRKGKETGDRRPETGDRRPGTGNRGIDEMLSVADRRTQKTDFGDGM
jgi:hypothetical protein